ncbi:uncharacterized protein LOC124155907 isoform X9 [Ischnura elegans]|uniref:uncharacterized protein LOC124155907 isoform X9 n=1 Tax=Ischnura elegans TaxID=197161 RepID=UPI001ED88D13|nr:uncharacterized protein LOC124155907 isoform X9 [Ischnura elegans]
MASFLNASKVQEDRCPVPEGQEEMVGLTVSVPQGNRPSSPADNKKPEQLVELSKLSTTKQGVEGSGDDDVGSNSISLSQEADNSQLPEDETEPKTVTPGKKPKYQYTREQLLELKNHPLSRQKPSVPNNDAPPFHRSRGWDQGQWHHGSRHENANEDDRGGIGDAPHEPPKGFIRVNPVGRRSGDPRERLRKEQDGIVLSPQRRNFNSGCFVMVTPQQQAQQQQQQQSSQHQQAASNRRPESPLGKGEREGHREITSNRRIGSGRIINRERDREYWVDFRVEREKEPDGEFGGFRGIRERERDERNIRSERRPFGRDFDRDRDNFGNGGTGERGNVNNKGSSERTSGRSGRYGNDRRRSYESRGEEEPEWFSGGPTSQHDTIELRGFEDIPEDSVAPNSGQRAKKQSSNSKTNLKSNASKKSPHSSGKTSPILPSASEAPALPSEKDSSNKVSSHSPKNSKPSSPVSNESTNKNSLNQSQDGGVNTSGGGDFNLEDFLRMDFKDPMESIQGLLTNGSSTEGVNVGGSRFSQFFRRESSPPNTAANMLMMSNQQNQMAENSSSSRDAINKAPGSGLIQHPDSRRSSLQDELLNNIINEITEPNIVIPSLGGPDSYFAPISPAASTTIGGGIRGQDQDSSSKPSLLLEMLHRGNNQLRNQNQTQQPDNLAPGMMKPPSIKDLEVSGKLQSVEELEAHLRQSSAVGSGGRSSAVSRPVVPGGNRVRMKADVTDFDSSTSAQSDEELAAFKKLLAQMSGGQAVPAANGVGQHFGILQMLGNKDSSQQSSNLVSQAGGAAPGAPTPNDPSILGGILGRSGGLAPSPAQLGSGPAAPRPSPLQQSMIPPDLVVRLLQVQQHQQQQQQQQLQRHQEWFSKLAGAQSQQVNQQPMAHMQPPHHTHIPHLHHGAPAGVSQRVQGQLGPLSSIANLPASPTPSTSLSPLPPELQMVINQNQSGRDLLQRPDSQNIMRGMAPHRVPSPRELRAHTQQIMHAALIKKKLEEQKENFRRKQEMQQQSLSPNPGTGGTKVESSPPPAKHSPTPLGFTPTSVLRKMTAEKDPLASLENASMSIDSKNMQSQFLSMASQGQQQSSNQWKNESHVKTQPGRAIVKGGGGNSMNAQYGSVMDYQSQKMSHLMDNHSQSQASSNLMQNAGHGMHGGQYSSVGSRGSKSTPRNVGVNSSGGAGISSNSQFIKSPVMLMRPAGINAAAAAAARVQSLQMAGMQNRASGSNPGSRMNSGGYSIPHGLSPSLQLLLNQNSYVGMGGNMGGPGGVDRSQHGSSLGVRSSVSNVRPGSAALSGQSTSPTNQLARWFSPELLAKARAGKLPDMPPVSTQRALSLEEVERLQQAATSVRN